MPKTKLHELLAVMADTTNAAQAIQEETKTTFSKKPERFRGGVKTVTFLDVARSGENSVTETALVDTVDSKLEYSFMTLGRHYDALLQLEEANQRAKADLVVDGQTLMQGAPAQFLLGMESRLKSLREVVLAAPTIEPGIKWEADVTAGGHVFVADMAPNFKTEKTVKHKVLYDATDKHPAQIEKWNEDVPVARIETRNISGMLTPLRKSEILGRLDRLLAAVKQARQRATTVEVENLHIAKGMFAYVMGA
jgi:hypothetical protein